MSDVIGIPRNGVPYFPIWGKRMPEKGRYVISTKKSQLGVTWSIQIETISTIKKS